MYQKYDICTLSILINEIVSNNASKTGHLHVSTLINEIVTTSNYSAVANSHTLQFTTTRTKTSQFVFTSRFMVMEPNNVLCSRPSRLVNIS
jgi:hypothetical protein